MAMLTPDAQSKFRPRRRHKKSRNGCMECKRRRIKCDEMKPSCSRCILTRQECIYRPTSPPPQAAANVEPSLFLPPPSPRSAVSPSPSPSYEIPRLSPAPFVKPTQHFDFDTTDAGLYHHYLQHTCRSLTDNQQDHHALQICIPTLALRSKTVYHSILAVSAACMCCDMIYKDPPPDISTVSNTLMAGYHHYNLASERLRELISRPSPANAEPLLAAPPLLVPFATASQQINHWISSRSEGHPSQKLLATTPRDVIILSRGISATIRALASHPSSSSLPTSPQTFLSEELDNMDMDAAGLDTYNDSPLNPSPPTTTTTPLPPSHNHPMYHIIKSTSEAAFAKLQDRLDSAFIFSSPTSQSENTTLNPSALAACASALDYISTLRSAVFPPSHLAPGETTIPLPPTMTHTPHLPTIPPWLAAFTCRPSTPSPTAHMTRPFLSLFVHAPQAYLDLTLPLLDKRLEGPMHNTTPGGVHDELGVVEALALDIYAHWSVLMFLVAEESWFIGKLPQITLAGMLNRFGEDFVAKIWGVASASANASSGTGVTAGQGQECGEWWPSSMLRIQREIGRYR
ncbi:hypothetical protein ASPCAL12158 [Aspergillus calidoustus]|uniref:Zn(2)-C6 fungal-type domain-containing protein n=2 Tax=Aspergillus calidoustus TaxID=454130 RepID=A0A0U5GB32_ASPCI|nr:hypothetical protein ASPCAL12158 [Aspergillus calidoustus]